MLDDNNDLQVYTIHDVEKFMQITQRTVYDHMKSGNLKGIKVGNKWRFTRKQILDYIQRLERKVEIKKDAKD
ncbi:MAG: helix-turn-helix domain-containing protein [Candidatus Izemoplasmatales bacterium]|jgi:predicted DNA-binding transcriptional regulator AlpA|nr:helix-turn-helix domain-containing protein [Bacillota bacterium]